MFWLLIELLSDLLLKGDLTIDLALLHFCDIVRLEWNILLLEEGAPLRHHFRQTARCVGASEDSGLREALGLHQHIDAVVDLRQHVVGLKRDVILAKALSFGR